MPGQALAHHTIWEKFRAGFSIPSHKDQAAVKKYIRYYKKRPKLLNSIFTQAKWFLYPIIEATDRQQLPLELALVPFVESGYRPYIVSHANAQGMWQLRPPSAKRFGIDINDPWFNGMYDVTESTRAGLKYLKKLHRYFKKDWLIALAAYNYGEGNMNKAIRRNRKKGLPIDYFHLKLPTETTNHVPKLLAIAEIIRHPKRYGITLPDIPDKPLTRTFLLNHQISFNLVSQLANVDINTLVKLNPGYTYWATHPTKKKPLHIPAKHGDAFVKNYRKFPKNKISRWGLYTVKRGDTLSKIAKKTQASIGNLKFYNRLKSSTIYPGTRLMYPKS